MAGYQGWFRCPASQSDTGWSHWSANPNRIDPESIKFEIWPDMSAYPSSSRVVAPGFLDSFGNQCFLYSGVNAKVIESQFTSMRDYDIDGIWLQRFIVNFPGQPVSVGGPAQDDVMAKVISTAGRTGRVWAISYDLAGAKGAPDVVFALVADDWQKLVDQGTTAGPRYLHQNGLPVVSIWDFINDHSRPITPGLIQQFVNYFHTSGKYRAYLVSGGDWNFAAEPPEWQAAFKGFDAYIPWNIGNVTGAPNSSPAASMGWWKADKVRCEAEGVRWIPTIYPGFSWNHLLQITDQSRTSTIARRGGRFYWEQWRRLKQLDIKTVFIAMFDEVDEGTSIDKNTNNPPVTYNGAPLPILPFVTYDGESSDWYLFLTQCGRKLLRGEISDTSDLPKRR